MAACGAREFEARFGVVRTEGVKRAVRRMLPFSLRSSPPSDPGRSVYLRGVLCALRQIATPLGGLGVQVRDLGAISLYLATSRDSEIASRLRTCHVDP